MEKGWREEVERKMIARSRSLGFASLYEVHESSECLGSNHGNNKTGPASYIAEDSLGTDLGIIVQGTEVAA